VVHLADVVEGGPDQTELAETLQQVGRILEDGLGLDGVQDELVIGQGIGASA
jgi:hypothetical protein